MNKNLLFSLWLTLFTLFSSVAWGQETIFSENMGNPRSNTSVASNIFQNSSNPSIIFFGDDNTDVRTSNLSSGYVGASGGGNVLLNKSSKTFIISGIDTSDFNDIKLSFGHRKSVSNQSNQLKVYVINGEIETELTYSRPTGSGTNNWLLITATGEIPSVRNLKIKFKGYDTNDWRIDDVKLTGVRNVVQSPTITSDPTSLTTFSTYIGTASISQSFKLTGDNLDGSDVVITAPASYEISESATGNYGETITIDTPTSLTNKAIYVRLKADNTIGVKSGNITVSGGGIAAALEISVSGQVLALPDVPVLTPAQTSSVVYGLGGTYQVASTGGSITSWSPIEGLVNGITFSNGTFTIANTVNAGIYTYDVSASNVTGSSSTTFTLNVNPAEQVFPTFENKTGTIGEGIVLDEFLKHATVSTLNASTINYTSSNPALVQVVNNKLNLLGVTEIPVTITVTSSNDNENYIPNTSEQSFTVAVDKKAQTISGLAAISKPYGSEPFQLTSTSTSGAPLVYTVSDEGDTDVVSIEGDLVTVLNAGTTKIKVVAPETDEYASVTNTIDLEVTPIDQSLFFESIQQAPNTTFELPHVTEQGAELVYSSDLPSRVNVVENILYFNEGGNATITVVALATRNYNEFTTTFTAKTLAIIRGSLPHQESFVNTLGDWTNYIISGGDTFYGWNKTSDGVQANGYNLGNTKAYLISPSFVIPRQGAQLSVDLETRYEGKPLKLMVSYDYDGFSNPENATWTELRTINQPSGSANSIKTTSVNNQSITQGLNVHIAVLYEDGNTKWAMWKVKNLSLIAAPLITPVISTNTIDGTYGNELEKYLVSTGIPLSWEITEGILPQGLNFDSTNGKIYGTPEEVVTNKEIKVIASNEEGTSAPKTIKITIDKATQTVVGLQNSYEKEVYDNLILPLESEQNINLNYTLTSNNSNGVVITNNMLKFTLPGVYNFIVYNSGDDYYKEYTKNIVVNVNDLYLSEKLLYWNFYGESSPDTSVADQKNTNLSTSTGNLIRGTDAVTNGAGNSFRTTGFKNDGISITNQDYFETSINLNSSTSKILDLNRITGRVDGTATYFNNNNNAGVDIQFAYNKNNTGFVFINTPLNIKSSNKEFEINLNDIQDLKGLTKDDIVVFRFYATGQTETGGFGFNSTSSTSDGLSFYGAIHHDQTIWSNLNWSNGVPTINKDAVLLDDLLENQSLTANKIIVKDDVVVPTGVTINVEDNVEVRNGGSLTFQPGAYFIQNSNATNIGNVTYQAQSQVMYRNDMSIWSSPVQGQKIRAFSPETLANRFWWYDEATTNYLPLFIEDPTDIDFEPAKGIAIRVRNTLPTGSTEAKLGSFTGVLNNGNYSISATKTVNGYNLVGNPYPSNIDVDKFFLMNPDVEKIFIWTPHYRTTNPLFGNNYVTINKAGASGIVEGDIRTIAAGQGFFVQVNNDTTILFDNSLRTADAGTFRRRENNRYWLSLTKEGVTTNRILVSHRDGATIEEDHQYDAKSVEEGATKIYTKIGADNYSIQSRPFPLVENERIPLGITTNSASEMAIAFENAEGIFAASQEVFVEDKALNVIHNLSVEPYVFTANEGITDDRFEIIYFNRTLATSEIERTGVKVYQHINKTVIESEKAIQTVKVYDALGRQVLVQKNIRSNKTELQIPKGVYYLTIELDNQTKVSEKVLIK